jgi:hypothetical protein
MIPKLVENCLDQLKEDGHSLKDYRIIGQNRGIMIILKYALPDTEQCNGHHGPLHKHKSPAKQDRDKDRLHQWWNTQTTNLDRDHPLEPQDLFMFGNNVTEFGNCEQHEENKEKNEFVCSENTKLEIGLVKASTVASHIDVLAECYSVSVQTDLEINPALPDGAIQCMAQARKSVSAGVQCAAETRTTGTGGHKPQGIRHRCMQTEAQGVKSLGVNAIVPYVTTFTQTKDIQGNMSKYDQSTMCVQSPSVQHRHVQTHICPKSDTGTNPKKRRMKTVATDTCDARHYNSTSIQTDSVLFLSGVSTTDPPLSSTICEASPIHTASGLDNACVQSGCSRRLSSFGESDSGFPLTDFEQYTSTLESHLCVAIMCI